MDTEDLRERKHQVVSVLLTGQASNHLSLYIFIAQHVHILYACYCLLIVYLKIKPPTTKLRTYSVVGKATALISQSSDHCLIYVNQASVISVSEEWQFDPQTSCQHFFSIVAKTI